MKNLQKTFQIIKQYHNELFYKDGASEDEIKNAETLLGNKFPQSYKHFLKSYGYLGFGGIEIFGLYNETIIRKTISEREAVGDNRLPEEFIVIHQLGNGEISCLDTSRMNLDGECPVVGWYFGYVEDIAEDFGSFLLEKINLAITWIEEEENEK